MMQTLAGFDAAFRAGIIQMEPVPGSASIRRHQDHPQGGSPRMTYAQFKGANVTGIAVFVMADPYEGLPCIQIGYAVCEAQRGKGVAKRLARVALADFTRFLAGRGWRDFAIEATVDRDNPASKAVASNLLGAIPEEKDADGVPVWHFIKVIRN
jgi:RimJ/RimL family protein N-acetyltransferase